MRLVEKVVLGLSVAASSGVLLFWPLTNSAARDVAQVFRSLARAQPADATVTQMHRDFLSVAAWMVVVAAVALMVTLALRPRWARMVASSWAMAVMLLAVAALVTAAAGAVYAVLAGVTVWFIVSGAHAVAANSPATTSDLAGTVQPTDAV